MGFIILAPMEKRWKRILIFFIIATAISNIFRFNVFEFKSELEKLPTWIFILTTFLLAGSGVIIGALIIIPFLEKQRSHFSEPQNQKVL